MVKGETKDFVGDLRGPDYARCCFVSPLTATRILNIETLFESQLTKSLDEDLILRASLSEFRKVLIEGILDDDTKMLWEYAESGF